MLLNDINEQLHKVFVNGKLPNMIYINKQESGRNKVERPLHKHDSVCEIVLVYKGTGTYLLNNTRYPIKEGDIVFYNQGDLHEISSSLDTEIGDYCLGIANLRLPHLRYNQLIPDGETPVRYCGNLFASLKNICQEIYTLSNSNVDTNLATQLLCASFIITALQTSLIEEKAYKSKDELFMTRILSYLNTNYKETILIEDIAKELGCSISYISHLFKKSTGITPIQYVIRRRIGLAQTMLISTDYTITYIATAVGYENTNYFIRLFTKIIGISPAKYRKFYLKELRGARNQN